MVGVAGRRGVTCCGAPSVGVAQIMRFDNCPNKSSLAFVNPELIPSAGLTLAEIMGSVVNLGSRGVVGDSVRGGGLRVGWEPTGDTGSPPKDIGDIEDA